MRRTYAVVAMAATFALFAATAAFTAGQGEPSGAPAEPITLRVLAGKGTNFPEDNIVKDELSRRTGVTFQLIEDEYAMLDQRLNLMISGGDVPDILFWSRPSRTVELAGNGIIIALDELLARYGKEIVANKGDMIRDSRTCKVGGKVYAIPRTTGGGNPRALAVRQDWLRNVGLQTPTELSAYRKVLEAFTRSDPNKNGKADTIGFGGIMANEYTFAHVLGAYGVVMGRPLYVEGQLLDWPMQPGFLDAMRFLNDLYRNRLMDPDFGTIKIMPALEKLWTGQYGTFEFAVQGTTQNWLTRYTESPKPEFVYTYVLGPAGKGGYPVEIQDADSFLGISAACKHPEEAMKLLDFGCSEDGDRFLTLGIEGRHWEYKDKVPTMIAPYDDAQTLRNEGGYVYRAAIGIRMYGTTYERLNEMTQSGVQMALAHPIRDDSISERPVIEQDIGTILTDLTREYMVSLIVSEGNLEKEYQTFRDKYLAAGGKTWIEQATAIYRKEYGTK